MAIQEISVQEVENVSGGAGFALPNIALQNVLSAAQAGVDVLLAAEGQATGLTPVTSAVANVVDTLIGGINKLATGIGTGVPLTL